MCPNNQYVGVEFSGDRVIKRHPWTTILRQGGPSKYIKSHIQETPMQFRVPNSEFGVRIKAT